MTRARIQVVVRTLSFHFLWLNKQNMLGVHINCELLPTNGHFIHVGPLKETGVSIMLLMDRVYYAG